MNGVRRTPPTIYSAKIADFSGVRRADEIALTPFTLAYG
jgi:hypothetical protein